MMRPHSKPLHRKLPSPAKSRIVGFPLLAIFQDSTPLATVFAVFT